MPSFFSFSHWIFLVFLSPLALGQGWKEVWQTKVLGSPRAAFFSVSGPEIFLSLDGADNLASLQRLSLDGKISKKVIEQRGKAGPLRAHGDRIYWIAGEKLYSIKYDGSGMRTEMPVPNGVEDVAFDSRGSIFLGGVFGLRKGNEEISGTPVTGLFSLAGDIFVLEEGRLLWSLNEPKGKKIRLCEDRCQGLEKSSDGYWITSSSMGVFSQGSSKARNKNGRGSLDLLVDFKNLGLVSPVGRFAYVYRKESQEDLLIIPSFYGGVVRAFRKESTR